MTDRSDASRCVGLLLVFCLVTTTAAARSYEDEPLDDRNTTADGSRGSAAGQKTRREPGTEETTPARGGTRWERFRESIWPFRTKRPERHSARPLREEPRTRWLVGRDIRYAPGADPDSSRPSDLNADPALAKAANELGQALGPASTVLGPGSGVAPANERVQIPLNPGQNLRDLPPAPDPLTSPPLPSAGQPGMSEDAEAADEPSVPSRLLGVSGSRTVWASDSSADTHSWWNGSRTG